MKKKEWMQSENPINLQSNQISLNEFELFEKFDENLEEKEWNLQQIREFYSLLYQYKPRNYVSKLLENNLNYNQEEYMEILGFNKKILICKILGIGLSVAGITTMILNLFISVSPLALLGLLMTGIGSLAISKSPNYFYNYYNKKFEDYYLEHHHTWGGREGFIDSVAELMVKVFDLGNPSSLNILGAISNLGIKHLDNSEYNGLPTKEELDLYKELKIKNKVSPKSKTKVKQYLSLIVAFTVILSIIISNLLTFLTKSEKIALFIILLIPCSEIIIQIIQFILSKTVNPKLIPKMDYQKGIPKEQATMVVIPTIVKSKEKVIELTRKLEVYYIANKSENLYFTLLGDCSESSKEE